MNLHSIICKTLGPGIHSLILVALFTGCANSSGPPVDLPVAKHAPAAMKHGRDTLVVTCTADRKVWMGGEIATNEGLNARLDSLRKKYESFTTVIRADRTTKFGDILALYRMCIVRHQDRCMIAVSGADPTIAYEMPIASRLANEGYDFGPGLRLNKISNVFSLNGHLCTEEQLDKALGQFAEITKESWIIIVSNPIDPIQHPVDLMNMCHRVGLARLILLETER